ncbi:hypothetical protein [Niabella beijingensis]|uniref:hypothetical protein n=1 Tax=Niabella beijingensis TaxID=2872700 RepID=UPI001CBE265F|nr:hypothetical protein [Niabella beijingensis]MBZ4188670.1 hypothetical protein [Niabella beijingensis]
MDENTDYLLKCREAVEKKLAWGDPSGWQNQDFENLSEQLFNETGVVLSTSTLKRVWGKVQYNSKPNLSTLDALARFIGHANWRAFTAAQPPAEVVDAPKRKKRAAGKNAVWFLLIATGALLIGFALIKKTSKKLSYGTIRFSSKPVTRGVPNTVIFEYDARQSNADSVFIQQSWDPRRRFRVDKDHNQYNSTYYLPGYYRAKLVLNDSIVKEHDVFIESNGWMGAIDQEPVPLYLGERIFKTPGQMGVTENDLKELHIDYIKTAPKVILTNVNRDINLNSTDFSLRLEVQNTCNNTNNAVCRKTAVTLLGTEGAIMIPLARIGCVGELNLLLGPQQFIRGTTTDLSAFGVPFNEPVTLGCISRQGTIKILINDKPVFEAPFKDPIGKIAGVRVSFEGTGFIRSYELKPAG